MIATGAPLASGSEIGQAAVDQALEAFQSRQQMVHLLPEIDPDLAVEVQDLVMMNLAPDYGGVAGYWWTLASNRDMVLSCLLENMFTSSGATLDLSGGAEQVAYLGWMLRVGQKGIGAMDEVTPWHESFSELIPTVVIRDKLLASEQKGDWSAMTMINTGVRYIVMGLPWQITKEEGATLFGVPLEALLADNSGQKLAGAMAVSTTRDTSRMINQLRERLSSRGRLLRSADLVWLGPTGSGVALGETERLSADFSTPLGQRRIVFAIRSPGST
ncbi:MAG TPA: hypothetical protein DIC24_01485 [Gammaproteobacteria bacterium]|nr:hypothetical protein [Gammaproteobacteria bacterium]